VADGTRGRGSRSLRIIAAAQNILAEIQPASVRAVCYRLFVGGLIPDMGRAATNSISRILARAREEGAIPWEWIVDESRRVEGRACWRDTSALIDAAVAQYRRDRWQDQAVRVQVWSEKGTIRGTLAPVLAELGVGFRVLHGYASATTVHEIAADSRDGKPLIAFYVGDWDPSGLHMSETDLPRRLAEYGARLRLERIALTRADLAGLPDFDPDTKRGDPRFTWFQNTIGSRCYELDAMSPPVLRKRVRDKILSLLDRGAWEHAAMIERAEVESMRAFGKLWQASICPGSGADAR